MRRYRRNITIINNEIDYDKLAEAIVAAQKRIENDTAENLSTDNKKPSFFVAIGRILRGDHSKEGRFLSAPFAFIVSIVYRLIAIVGFIALVLFLIGAGISIVKSSWQGLSIIANIIYIFITLLIAFAIFLYMVIFWGAANDMEHETDKNYVIGVFSGLVSVASLVVAIIALYKGIG